MRAIMIIGGGLAGGVVGYFAGAYVMCTWI